MNEACGRSGKSRIMLPHLVNLLAMGSVATLMPASALEGPKLFLNSKPDGAIEISWLISTPAFRLESSLSLGRIALWQPVTQAPVVSGDRWVTSVRPLEKTSFFRLRQGSSPPGARVRDASPAPGESGVAVTRETILRFSEPLAQESTLSLERFHALFGGRRILARPELSSDGWTATLFYLEPLPASATITVLFDGSGLRDAKGSLLDADGDGVEGGVFRMQFNTLGTTPLDGTGVVGHVYAAELGPGGTNRPLQGVTITVDGAEETLRAVTDAKGAFHLYPSPAGRFFVHIDGRTATGSAWPNGAYYPAVGKAWEAQAGHSNNLAGGNGEIFLPLISAGALQPVSAVADTVVTVPASLIGTNTAFTNVMLTVPANALFSDNGTRGGRVGLAMVPPDRLPEPLPTGLAMSIVITVQTDGPLNFDRPVPVCFPNLPDPILGRPLPPGARQALISFNHDKGRWEAVGSMTVSPDGQAICSDPGSGILQPGWHGSGPFPLRPKPVNDRFGLPKGDDDDDDDDFDDGCDGPDQEALEQCIDLQKDLEEKCRKIAKIAFDARVENCGGASDGGAIDIDAYDQCVQRAKDRYEKDLANCREDRVANVESCIDCVGPRPDIPSTGGFSVGAAPKRGLALASAAPSIAELVDMKFDELVGLYSQTPPLSPEVRVRALQTILDDLAALTGNDVRAFLLDAIVGIERAEAGRGTPLPLLDNGTVTPYPVKYAAHVLRPSGDFYIRGQTEALLNYEIFVPADGLLVGVDFYDPVGNRVGHVIPHYGSEATYPLPRVLLHPVLPETTDTDGDGLVDLAEHVYGTDQTQADTDGDGLTDGAEARQGTDPLDDLPMGLGAVASVLTLGPAVDVSALHDIAVVAEGTAGVSIFDTRNVFSPVRVAQLDTPGEARAVALEGTLAAVADGPRGVAILDLASPSAASIVHQVALSGEAMAVAVADGLAYVGLANGRVSVVEMRSGRAFETVALGVNSISDVLVTGDALYVLAARRLMAFALDQGALAPAASVESPGSAETSLRRLRLSGGGELLYAVNGAGFNVFSLANPLAPVLLQRHTTAQLGWKQVVANGSGLAVGVVGINPLPRTTDDVYLHEVSPAGTNSVFLTRLTTPGVANALSIHNGLAYVADGANGLLVLNYTGADTRKVPPRIELSASFPLPTNAQAPSASPARVRANVSDDVQVRNVEFYGNGRLFASDGNFPFEVRFVTPLLSETNTSFTLQARALDTGGNFVWSDRFTVDLVPDTSRPKVRRVSPVGGGAVIDRITVYCTEVLDQASLNANSFAIVSAGADGQMETPDDQVLMNATYSVRPDDFSASASFPEPLPDGLYRAALTTAVTDRSRNPLSSPTDWSFRVGKASFWAGPFTGSWQDPANWSKGAVPGSADDVVVDVSYGTGRIVVAEPIVVQSLELFEELEVLKGASLEVTGPWTAHRDVIVNGGAIRNATLTLLNGALLKADRTVGASLESVTLNGDIVLEASSWLQLSGNLALNGSLTLLTNAGVIFATSSLTNGTIQFAGSSQVDSASVTIAQRATVTWGPAVLLRGRSGTVAGSGTLIHRGRISAGELGGHLQMRPGTLTHDGTAEVFNGAQLSFGAGSSGWNGTGSVQVINGTLNLDGQFGPLTTPISKGPEGIVRIAGQGNLQGGTLTLTAATGAWILDGGTLGNGILNQTEGASLRPVGDQGILEQMTVHGDLVLDNGSLNIRNGLSMHGTLLLGTNKFLRFLNSQTMTNGIIEFAGPLEGAASPQIALATGTTLTLAPGVWVHGRSGSISGSGTLMNQGRISADVPGATIRVRPAIFLNDGILEEINGGSLIAPGFP